VLIISLFLPLVPEGKSLIISTLPKSPLEDLGADSKIIDFSEWTQAILFKPKGMIKQLGYTMSLNLFCKIESESLKSYNMIEEIRLILY